MNEAFKIVHALYRSMDYGMLPLEESVKHHRGKAILANVLCWLNGGSETHKLRLAGKDTPDYPSSIPEEGFIEVDFPENIPTNPRYVLSYRSPEYA